MRLFQISNSVQGPGFRFWPGHQVVQVNSFFFNQNNVVLVKTIIKANGCNRVNLPGHTWFFLFLFFLQSGRVPISGRPGPGSTRRAGPDFKTITTLLKHFKPN